MRGEQTQSALHAQTSPRRSAGGVEGRPGECGWNRYWWKYLHAPGRIIETMIMASRLQPFHDIYPISPSRLWPCGTPLRNTVYQNHACRCRQPVRKRRRAYRPSVPVAGGM